MEKSSAIIILFDGRRIVNGCKPGIATPFNALVSCYVPIFDGIFHKLESHGPEKVHFLDFKTQDDANFFHIYQLPIALAN